VSRFKVKAETRSKRVCGGVQIDASPSRASQKRPPFTMVSSLLVESLSSPTDVLLSFYDAYDHDAINEFPKAVAKHFSDIFRTEEAFLEVRPPHPS
jgi:hypothetical protein